VIFLWAKMKLNLFIYCETDGILTVMTASVMSAHCVTECLAEADTSYMCEEHRGASSHVQISKVGDCAVCLTALHSSAIYRKACLLELTHPSFVCPFHRQLL
jgi:hypothetical protein